MTNTSAMTALQTLQMTNQQLDKTQNEISTGYKVANASDNAAYWSIATTMRSDNNSLSTVNDALGLGSATVNTAYMGMNQVKDTLDAIKKDLVTATQPGVDKSKIQSDIDEQLAQLKTYANGTGFSGNNWLSVNSTAGSGYNATQSVVASFTRGTDGTVSLGTIDVDITKISLFNADTTAGATKGLLQDSGTAATATSGTALAWTKGDMDAGGSLTIQVKVNGTAQNVKIAVADPATFTASDIVAGLNAGLTGATASLDGSNNLVLSSTAIGSSASVQLVSVAAAKADGSTSTATIGVTSIAEAKGADTGGLSIMDLDITNATSTELSQYLQAVDGMFQNVTTAASDLGAVQSRISSQQTFVKALMDSIDSGVGSLVDADMNEASTRLKALQTQQQLGIQALSIANSNSQNILSLFRS
jgi:flagellin